MSPSLLVQSLISAFKLRGSDLAHGAYRPLFVDESFARQLGVRSAGAAHKNIEAPQGTDSSDARS